MAAVLQIGNEAKANFELIQAVRERPVLWDTTLLNYRTTSLKRSIWMEVANAISAENIREKRGPHEKMREAWERCRDRFKNLTKRYRDLRKRGKLESAANAAARTSWMYYEAMSFLDVLDDSLVETPQLESKPSCDSTRRTRTRHNDAESDEESYSPRKKRKGRHSSQSQASSTVDANTVLNQLIKKDGEDPGTTSVGIMVGNYLTRIPENLRLRAVSEICLLLERYVNPEGC